MKSKQVHEGPHKYFKDAFKASGTLIFRCALPGCQHFVYEALILNRHSICFKCHKIFIITPKTLRVKKFHCVNCVDLRLGAHRRKRSGQIPVAVDNIVDDLLLTVTDEELPEELKDLFAEVDNENRV